MRKKARKRSSNRAAMTLIIFIVGILTVFIAVQSHRLQSRITANDQRLAEVEQQIQDEKARTQEIQELEDYMQTDEYLEKVAKDKLGLIQDNEIIFKEED